MVAVFVRVPVNPAVVASFVHKVTEKVSPKLASCLSVNPVTPEKLHTSLCVV
ncbi:hypothetical protein [Caudoviricetes sp.]|nr:hypothetical protein [Caudoviricetes sp.]